MVIDSHAHVTAPDALYVFKAGILAHRGAHGRGGVSATDDDIIKAHNSPVFGGSSHLEQLKEAGTDMQIISPRPYQMMSGLWKRPTTSLPAPSNSSLKYFAACADCR
jgi:OH-DDVA meta-cleavage compound hydrolase